ncbi:glycogen debranching protein GlgX [Sphingomonas sanguinis]|jgi:glycogen operon protein|uniref:Glycogen debranching protein GlgX n=1 Tax=Sphingomonas sanguinis TaxID=33051 RepID=A0A7Y7QTI6_9SPHN|nr:glycogen debranching protein GlgX [Sphingomonas sanguinis]MBZ6380912.1 glycogen debranching protein GlgX [Sphingomonas sanguinis]NNG50297.1 glycogen debranching protein GlgX [Sphingomonas sanguinis]NNG53545.1 glycogen debranching protein GlgX [Sphingomonas sanguinis]NVP30214.1 glycogen debranching protein GlgX [Sphingomonas sanguinis]
MTNQPYSLGATPAPGSTSFTVRSTADRVELCLFDGADERRIAMTRDGDVWSATAPGTNYLYGYRAHGEYDPARNLWFDPAKLLVDPYALELDRPFIQSPRLAAYGEDTADIIPRAHVVAPLTATPAPPLFRPGGLIYELNVRGFTMRHPAIPPEQRGTLAALAHPAVLDHLSKLGVAAVEVMPITAAIDERHLPPLGLRNAWGYNPVVPMALCPERVPGGIAELVATVATLRQAGIGVILDLVFNHMGESDVHGGTLSFRGLDPDAYARTTNGTLINDAGTGNTLDASRPGVRAMILDSLRHFARAGVDGFRFDLAPVLARGPGFDARAPIFAEIAADPILSTRIMIAEPWDIGPGGYQLGHFPEHWLEWNDKYRDQVRRFWRGDGRSGDLATRIAGSADVFASAASRSVNLVAAHDGFTLADLVAYAGRHNHANGEDNRDGHGDEVSWNHGQEGPTDDPAIRAARTRSARAMLATVFLSRGTPMLTAGDEFGRSQNGNNNGYAQDNETTWLDWETRDEALEGFVAGLSAFRRATPIEWTDWLAGAEWRNLSGAPMTPEDWDGSNGFALYIPVGNENLILRFDRARGVSGIRGTMLES